MKLRAVVGAAVLSAFLFASALGMASAHHQPCHPKSACEVPEVPWALVLPAGSVGLAGAYYLVGRLRHGRGDDADDGGL